LVITEEGLNIPDPWGTLSVTIFIRILEVASYLGGKLYE
jgi:hypothetical protein